MTDLLRSSGWVISGNDWLTYYLVGYSVCKVVPFELSVTDSALDIGDVFAPQKEEKKERPFGARNPAKHIEARQQRLYKKQLDGLTPRQLVLEHASRESIAVSTAWRDWNQVQTWNEEDWEGDREKMLPRLQQMRARLFLAGLKRGQLQTCAQILDSLGRVVGEQSPEQIAISAPQLTVSIADKRND